jgi:hypothetical protein
LNEQNNQGNKNTKGKFEAQILNSNISLPFHSGYAPTIDPLGMLASIPRLKQKQGARDDRAISKGPKDRHSTIQSFLHLPLKVKKKSNGSSKPIAPLFPYCPPCPT